MLSTLKQPRVLVPILLSMTLLAFVLSLANLPLVIDRIAGITLGTIVLTLFLAAVYLALKAFLFHYLLEHLQIFATWRQLTLAFAIGEMTLALPAGIYAQNWVLQRIEGADFPRSSAGTMVILAAEAWGYNPTQSLTMLLGFRLVWTGSVWLLCGPIALLLWGEFAPSAADDR